MNTVIWSVGSSVAPSLRTFSWGDFGRLKLCSVRCFQQAFSTILFEDYTGDKARISTHIDGAIIERFRLAIYHFEIPRK